MSPLLGDVSLRVGGVTPTKAMHQGVEVWPGGSPPDPDTDFWYDFEGGTIGSRMDPADAYGSGPWSSLGWPYPTYRTDEGSTVAELDAGDTLTSIMQRDGSPAAMRSCGFWVKVAQAPTGDTRLCDLRNTSSSGTVAGVLLRANLTLRFMLGSSGDAAHTSPAITLGQWYYIALAVSTAPANAQMVVYHNSDLNTPIYQPGAWAISTSYTTPTTMRFGRVTTSGDIGLTQFNDIFINDDSFDVIYPSGLNRSTT